MAADTYATLYPLVAGQGFKAANLNFIRTAISNRATVIGATVTLPATMADDEPIDLDDELFHDWLDTARTAVEALIAEAGYYKWDTSALEWVAWATIAELLTYVHGQWSAATRNSSGHDVDAWMPYDDPSTLNQFLIGYVNELYYCLECLSIHEVAVTFTSIAASARSHLYLSDGGYVIYIENTGTDLGTKHGDGGWAESETVVSSESQGNSVAGDTQTGTLANTVVKAGSVALTIGPASYQDQGDGTFAAVFGPSVTASSINYNTGAWSLTTDSAIGAGAPMSASYSYDYTAGATKSEAHAAGWAAFEAASYVGASSGAHLTIPDTEWELLLLWAPWRYDQYSGAPGWEISSPDTTGEFTAVLVSTSSGVQYGFVRMEAGWNDEEVHIAMHLTGIEEGSFGSDTDTTDYYPQLALRAPPTYPWYGKNTFDGYCNTAYVPL